MARSGGMKLRKEEKQLGQFEGSDRVDEDLLELMR